MRLQRREGLKRLKEKDVKKWLLLLYKLPELNLSQKYNLKMTQIKLMKKAAVQVKKMKELLLSNNILRMRMMKNLFFRQKMRLTILLLLTKLRTLY